MAAPSASAALHWMQNRRDQLSLLLGCHTFYSQQDHRGSSLTGDREVHMKIVVERDTNPARKTSGIEKLTIISLRQSDRTHVYCVDAPFAKQDRRTRSQALVEQNRNHATRSMPRLSSSTLAAA